MTRLEALGIAVSFAVIGGLLAWLLYSHLVGRRRIPERLVYEFPPGMVPVLTKRGRRFLSWPWEVSDAELPDFDFPTTPPSAPGPSKWAIARPWAHG